MLTKTAYGIDTNSIDSALKEIPNFDFRLSINQPTGNFFYDTWKLKPEFVGTVWETLYNSLPEPKGEARIIKLEAGSTYSSHADIDDRWHLNLSGNNCYLIDIDAKHMDLLQTDGIWYSMNASPRHTAVNFGNRTRYQLVVRKLLTRGTNPLFKASITSSIEDLEDRRFEFDNRFSSVLNLANKGNCLDNFSFTQDKVSFDIHQTYYELLETIVGDKFKVSKE